jgi:hypothetical protein
MAGDRKDGLMTDITADGAMAVPPKLAGLNSERSACYRFATRAVDTTTSVTEPSQL